MHTRVSTPSTVIATVIAVALLALTAGPALALQPPAPGAEIPDTPSEATPEPTPSEDPEAPSGPALPPGPGAEPPEEQEVEDGRHPTHASPFDVLLEVEVTEPNALAEVQLVQPQYIIDDGRRPTELWIDFGDGQRHSKDLTDGIPNPWLVQRRYPTDAARTYTVTAWVNDSAGGVSSDSVQVDVLPQYDVALTRVEFTPWFHDCDSGPLRGKGDFDFGFHWFWRGQSVDRDYFFKLDDAETKSIPLADIVAVGATTDDPPRINFSWSEDDGYVRLPPLWADFNPVAYPPIPMTPDPSQADQTIDVIRTNDDCIVRIVFHYETRPYSGY